MSEQVTDKSLLELIERFQPSLRPDERPGYEGYIVAVDSLLDFMKAAHDEFGYDYLSSLTGVDYLPDAQMEVVYHLYKTTGGPALVVKTQVPREQAVVPSLVSIYPGADFQEREAWDLLGIRFEGHPNLLRILMWEGFEGHPLQKDWKEPYFEEEVKPYKSRWPGGEAFRIEEKVPLGDNVQYPAGFDPERWLPEGEGALYKSLHSFHEDSDEELATDQLIINLGPQHPSTHGVFRMVVLLEGDQIVDL